MKSNAEAIIRHAQDGDYQDFLEIYSQPKVIKGTLQLPFPSGEVWKRRLQDKSEGVYALVAEVDGKVRANLGLQVERNPRRRHAASIGMAVHDHWQRKGLGNALLVGALELADGWLNLSRLELHVFSDNKAGIALYKKNGFKKEGTLKSFAFCDGRFKDVIAMARVKD